MSKECVFCKKLFSPKGKDKSPSHFTRNKFCSKKCSGKARIGTKWKSSMSDEARKKIASAQFGRSPSEETRKKMRLAKIGKKQSDEHKEKIRIAHLKRVAEGKHNNYKGGVSKNIEYVRWLKHCWQRRKRLAQGTHSYNDWRLLCSKYNWTCLACKVQEPEIKLSQDHIIPLSKGGTDNIENIQPLCLRCNIRKHTKTISYLT